MSALIAISNGTIGGGMVQTVNARDLHSFLEVGKDFSTWVKDRISQFNFVENQDFVCSPISGNQKGRGGDRRTIDYHLTLDMAKELSMVERNEKGKQARQYFIECERRAMLNPIDALNDPATMRNLLLTYSEKVLTLQPKADAFDRIATASGSLSVTDAAKSLQVNPKYLFSLLSLKGWIYRRPGHAGWIGYHDKIKIGYLEHKVTPVERSDGTEKIAEQVRVTPKGLARLAELLNEQKKAA